MENKNLKTILKTEYIFSNDQKMVYEEILKGIISTKISQNCGLSKNYTSKLIKEIKDITGLTTEDIRYLQRKNKSTADKLSKDEIEIRKNISEKICKKYLGYSNTKDFPSFFYIRLSQFRKKYSYLEIYETLNKYEKDLDYAFSHKTFTGISHKINYIFIVLTSHIDDVKIELNKNKEKNIKHNLSTDNYVAENINNISVEINIPKKKDFSKYLDTESEDIENEQDDII